MSGPIEVLLLAQWVLSEIDLMQNRAIKIVTMDKLFSLSSELLLIRWNFTSLNIRYPMLSLKPASFKDKYFPKCLQPDSNYHDIIKLAFLVQ